MNSGWYPLLIGLLYLVIHVASIVAKEAAKRKERERMMEQAERRRMAEARLEIPPPDAEHREMKVTPGQGRTPVLSPAPPTIRGVGRIDDLAMQRKQQLEQMRARQIGGPSQQTRTTQMPRRGAPPAPLPPSQLPQQLRIEPDRNRLRREAKMRAEQLARAPRPRAAQIHPLSEKEAQREDSRQRRIESASLDIVGDTQGPRSVLIPEHKASPILLARLKDRKALREIFVMKELIDPPLALREQSI